MLLISCGPVSAATQPQADLADYYGFGDIEIIKLDWGIKNLQIADFNNDGRNDIVVANNRKSKIELLIQKEQIGPEPVQAPVDPNDADVNTLVVLTRFDRQGIPVSQQIHGMVLGDFNADGLKDIAYHGEPKGLYVLLQKTSQDNTVASHPVTWQTRRKIPIDDGAVFQSALASGDINGDATHDLALVAKDGVYVITQKKDGTLSEPKKYPTSSQPLGVEVADLNGDRLNDLVLLANSDKPVHVRFGLTGGLLGPQQQFFIERPFMLTLDDVDGQPGQEMLTIDGTTGRLICYKFAASGDEDSDWPILFYPLPAGQGAPNRDLVLGDFDGDDLTDVIVSDPGSAELMFYRQVQDLGLVEPVRFPAFSDVTSLSAADIDADGKTELAVLSIKEKVIGISRFVDDRIVYPQPLDLAGDPLAVELADINNDGRIDCVYVCKDANDARSLDVLYGVASVIRSASEPAGDSVTVQTSGDSLPIRLTSLSANPDGMRIIDADQDGLKDVLLFVSYDLPVFVRQTTNGAFEVVRSASQVSLLKDTTLRSTAIANTDDKPGDELLVAHKNFARSVTFSQDGNWRVCDQYNAKSTENDVSAVAAFDLAGDGSSSRPTIIMLDGQKGKLQLLTYGSDKTYRFEKELEVGNWGNALHLKILFAPLGYGNTGNILVFDGEKFAVVIPPTREMPVQRLEKHFDYETKIRDGTYGNLIAGDINSDDVVDIIMVEHNFNNIEILTIDRAGKPIPATRFKVFEQKSYRDAKNQPRAAVEPRELAVADVTGDGKNDLVTIIHDRIIIYPQD